MAATSSTTDMTFEPIPASSALSGELNDECHTLTIIIVDY